MLISGDKRVRSRMAVRCRTGARYATASPGGPAGSALMTFFAVIECRAPDTASPDWEYLFTRYNATAAGWAIGRQTTTGNLFAFAYNSTPAAVVTPFVSPVLNVPLIVVAVYNNGSLTSWINGVSMGTTALGAGFTAVAGPTTIGHAAALFPARRTSILEAGMLDGYDATATIAALTAQWQEDLQQGRYLTWPRAMTASDWYWSGKDIAGGGGTCGPSWVDRGPNAVVMTRTGAPQSAIVMPRF